MGKSGEREDNPNWRGGRSIASNGYVLLRVGVGHHLADVRGYAYEHRVVAEKKAGRRLRKGELVHHINGNKQDNRPSNLMIAKGNAEHYVHHRKIGIHNRLPGEKNLLIECECGCGKKFRKFDYDGRPRRFVSGHNCRVAIPGSTSHMILNAMSIGLTNRSLIATRIRKSKRAVTAILQKLKAKGLIEQTSYREWRIK